MFVVLMFVPVIVFPSTSIVAHTIFFIKNVVKIIIIKKNIPKKRFF